MRDLYDKLLKILALEQSRAYANSAVIGGMDSFLAFWLSEATQQARSVEDRLRVREVTKRLENYAALSVEERQETITYLMERLGGQAKASPPPPPPPAADTTTRRPTPPQRATTPPRPPDDAPRRPGTPASKAPPPRQTTPAPRPSENRPPDKSRLVDPAPELPRSENRPPDKSLPATPLPPPAAAPVVPPPPVADEGRPADPPPPPGNAPPPAPPRATLPRYAGTVQEPRRPRRVPDEQPQPPMEEMRPSREIAPPVAGRATQATVPAWRGRETGPRGRAVSVEELMAMERELDQPLTALSGIGAAKGEKYAKLGLTTIRDLLYHAPFRYEDYTAFKRVSDLVAGDVVTIAAMVQDIQAYKSPRGVVVVTAILSDGTGTVRARWFGSQWLISQLRPGTMVRLSGKVEMQLGKLQLNSPRHETIDADELQGGRLVPIYPRTEGVTEKMLAKDIATALQSTVGRIPDPLPTAIRNSYSLPSLGQALRWLHQPETMPQAEIARRRLAFDELLRVQLGMLQQRRAWQAQRGHAVAADPALMERFIGSLPFTLTDAQQQSLSEILADMAQPYAMSRLLQGDVGSGKTVVAAAALLATVAAGYQGVLMAPTEILAEQHFAGIARFLNPEGGLLDRPLVVALLSGSMSAADKEATRQRLSAGEIDVLVGTHAVIQEAVEFSRLGLVIVDEQHRFGVRQRGALRSRNSDSGQPDVLVMSATPIPRSLALTLYGDLDLSIINELPPGREPIVTRIITPGQRERAYTYIRKQVEVGRQAFIICPLVEESEKLDARAAVEEHRFLQNEVFPQLQVGLLHGRMRPSEKEREMGRFYRNETQVLVSTAVVEVGIDVPNATAMLIEGANRFGLAQLHQFRGRIGRGAVRSLCLLMMENDVSADAEARLNALAENVDGFALAEADLQLRGPGDFFGTRQSGLPALQMAKLSDTPTLAQAREAATALLAHDPDLAQPDHALLRTHVQRYWNRAAGDLS